MGHTPQEHPIDDPAHRDGDHPVEQDGTGVQEDRNREHHDQHHDEPETERATDCQRAVQDLGDEAEEMDAAKMTTSAVEFLSPLHRILARRLSRTQHRPSHRILEGHETEKADSRGVLRQGEQRRATVEGAHRGESRRRPRTSGGKRDRRPPPGRSGTGPAAASATSWQSALRRRNEWRRMPRERHRGPGRKRVPEKIRRGGQHRRTPRGWGRSPAPQVPVTPAAITRRTTALVMCDPAPRQSSGARPSASPP